MMDPARRSIPIDHASNGDNTLLPARAGVKYIIQAVFLISAGTMTIRLESAAGGTALTGQMSVLAGSGFVLPYCEQGWFETAYGEALNLELSAGTSADGCLLYRAVGE